MDRKPRIAVRGMRVVAVLLLGACNLTSMAMTPEWTSKDDSTSVAPFGRDTPAPTDPPRMETVEPTKTAPAAPLTATPTGMATSSRRDEAFDSFTLITYVETYRYPITGSTAEELDAAMDLNGPRDDASGTAWFALTAPLFDWDWSCTCTESGCDTDAITISLSLSYSFPVWRYDEPPPDLLNQWLAFDSALQTHERGHGDLARACAIALGEAVASTAGLETCEAVDRKTLAAINAELGVCRDKQRAYEDQSNHGMNDGVIWPP